MKRKVYALSVSHPDEAGFSRIRWERVDQLVKEFVPERIPGLVYMVGHRGKTIGPKAFGYSMIMPEKVSMGPNTIFDLASLTKVIATTTAAMVCLERGHFRLDDPVQLYIPEFKGADKERVVIRHLMTHTSGLPAWVDLASECQDMQSAVRKISSLDFEYPTGTKVVYSCLGYILLGEIVARVTGINLADFCRQSIFQPLHMHETGFRPAKESVRKIAATEYFKENGILLHGVVHDENARAVGGVSGNAGLFSTAEDLAVFAQMILNGGIYEDVRVLSSASVSLMSQVHTPGLNESRGLGWIVKGQSTYCSGGDLISPEAIGHTGFTGTSLWIDPEHDLFVVLLTNRVHPSRDNAAHIRLRPLFHNVVMGALVS